MHIGYTGDESLFCNCCNYRKTGNATVSAYQKCRLFPLNFPQAYDVAARGSRANFIVIRNLRLSFTQLRFEKAGRQWGYSTGLPMFDCCVLFYVF